MCDCYEAECEKKECVEKIPVHIADCNFPREAVQVFCRKHLPKKKATIFEVTKESKYNYDDDCEKVGWKCAIRLCKGKINPESVGVHPNIGAEYKTYCLE